MPKNPNGGPAGPFDTPTTMVEDEAPQAASRGPGRLASERGGNEARPADSPAPAADAAAAETPTPGAAGTGTPGGHAVGERKKQFLIAPRVPPAGLQAMSAGFQAMSFQPLQLSTVEQALRDSPDIEIIDKVGPRNGATMMAAGMSGMGAPDSQGVLVARMTEQKAAALHQQAQGRLLVERDQFLALMDPPPFMRPAFVSNVVPSAGPAFTATIQVRDKDGAPVPEAEVSLFGSMLPATGSTDASGQATLSLFGETASSIRGLYVKPKADYWSFYNRDPDISPDEPNTVTLRALGDWPPLAGFPRQRAYGWGQKAMRLDQLPGNFRGQGIRIAVIDSGIATSHECLARVRAGFDIVNKRTNPNTWNEDSLGHGSHCAGMIGASELAFGVRGFAPEAEIHACKLFPGGQVSQLIDALEYCIEKQIDVVNLSLGGADVSEALEQQIQRAKRAGVACIVAAGNSGGPVQYPASSPNVLAVAAIGKLDEFPPDSYHAQTISPDVDANGFFTASFSCFGPQVAVCGPGVAITSTVPPNNYAAWDGTSMAAPHIAGLAALVLAHHPEFQGVFSARNAERVERLFMQIRMSARRISLSDPTRVGMGLPDAPVAVGIQPPQFAQAMAAQAMVQQAGMGAQAGAMGGLMAPAEVGMGSPMGVGMNRAGAMEPFAMDPALAAFASSMLPAGLGRPFGFMPSLPFGIGAPGYNRGW